MHAIYQLPTVELIDFISKNIEGKAIEIGSGNGSIGRLLGIPITDSKIQEKDEIKMYYDFSLQPIVKYPNDIINLEAGRAISKLKPDTVVGCWVTEWSKYPTNNSSYWGVDEKNILYNKKYIFVGNLDVHGKKTILQYDHEVYDFPWIISRAKRLENNRIWIWDRTIK